MSESKEEREERERRESEEKALLVRLESEAEEKIDEALKHVVDEVVIYSNFNTDFGMGDENILIRKMNNYGFAAVQIVPDSSDGTYYGIYCILFRRRGVRG